MARKSTGSRHHVGWVALIFHLRPLTQRPSKLDRTSLVNAVRWFVVCESCAAMDWACTSHPRPWSATISIVIFGILRSTFCCGVRAGGCRLRIRSTEDRSISELKAPFSTPCSVQTPVATSSQTRKNLHSEEPSHPNFRWRFGDDMLKRNQVGVSLPGSITAALSESFWGSGLRTFCCLQLRTVAPNFACGRLLEKKPMDKHARTRAA